MKNKPNRKGGKRGRPHGPGPRGGPPFPGTHGETMRPGIRRLGDLEPGTSGKIHRLSCRGKLRRRLMDMGIVCGTPIEVEKVAPLGDPLELKLKGFHLSLRKSEAGDIWVEVDQ